MYDASAPSNPGPDTRAFAAEGLRDLKMHRVLSVRVRRSIEGNKRAVSAEAPTHPADATAQLAEQLREWQAATLQSIQAALQAKHSSVPRNDESNAVELPALSTSALTDAEQQAMQSVEQLRMQQQALQDEAAVKLEGMQQLLHRCSAAEQRLRDAESAATSAARQAQDVEQQLGSSVQAAQAEAEVARAAMQEQSDLVREAGAQQTEQQRALEHVRGKAAELCSEQLAQLRSTLAASIGAAESQVAEVRAATEAHMTRLQQSLDEQAERQRSEQQQAEGSMRATLAEAMAALAEQRDATQAAQAQQLAAEREAALGAVAKLERVRHEAQQKIEDCTSASLQPRDAQQALDISAADAKAAVQAQQEIVTEQESAVREGTVQLQQTRDAQSQLLRSDVQAAQAQAAALQALVAEAMVATDEKRAADADQAAAEENAVRALLTQLQQARDEVLAQVSDAQEKVCVLQLALEGSMADAKAVACDQREAQEQHAAQHAAAEAKLSELQDVYEAQHRAALEVQADHANAHSKALEEQADAARAALQEAESGVQARVHAVLDECLPVVHELRSGLEAARHVTADVRGAAAEQEALLQRAADERESLQAAETRALDAQRALDVQVDSAKRLAALQSCSDDGSVQGHGANLQKLIDAAASAAQDLQGRTDTVVAELQAASQNAQNSIEAASSRAAADSEARVAAECEAAAECQLELQSTAEAQLSRLRAAADAEADRSAAQSAAADEAAAALALEVHSAGEAERELLRVEAQALEQRLAALVATGAEAAAATERLHAAGEEAVAGLRAEHLRSQERSHECSAIQMEAAAAVSAELQAACDAAEHQLHTLRIAMVQLAAEEQNAASVRLSAGSNANSEVQTQPADVSTRDRCSEVDVGDCFETAYSQLQPDLADGSVHAAESAVQRTFLERDAASTEVDGSPEQQAAADMARSDSQAAPTAAQRANAEKLADIQLADVLRAVQEHEERRRHVAAAGGLTFSCVPSAALPCAAALPVKPSEHQVTSSNSLAACALQRAGSTAVDPAPAQHVSTGPTTQANAPLRSDCEDLAEEQLAAVLLAVEQAEASALLAAQDSVASQCAPQPARLCGSTGGEETAAAALDGDDGNCETGTGTLADARPEDEMLNAQADDALGGVHSLCISCPERSQVRSHMRSQD